MGSDHQGPKNDQGTDKAYKCYCSLWFELEDGVTDQTADAVAQTGSDKDPAYYPDKTEKFFEKTVNDPFETKEQDDDADNQVKIIKFHGRCVFCS